MLRRRATRTVFFGQGGPPGNVQGQMGEGTWTASRNFSS